MYTTLSNTLVTRCVPIASISRIIDTCDGWLNLKVTGEHDMRFKCMRRDADLIYILRVLSFHFTGSAIPTEQMMGSNIKHILNLRKDRKWKRVVLQPSPWNGTLLEKPFVVGSTPLGDIVVVSDNGLDLHLKKTPESKDLHNTSINSEPHSNICPTPISWIEEKDPDLDNENHPPPVREFIGHFGEVTMCNISTNGKWLSSSSHDGNIKIWDIHTGHILFTFEHGGPVFCCRFLPCSSIVFSAGSNGLIKKWDVVLGRRIGHIKTKDVIFNLATSPNGSVIAAATTNLIKIFNSASLNPNVVLVGHTSVVFGVNFSQDGNILVSSSHDKSVRTWNWKERKVLQVFLGHDGSIWQCVFSPCTLR
eukprot:NODE_4692_length_1129_cov_53.023857_g4159_i0.p1 GENE.NODE_4692_length_1129_cov_53.023857_g4159_i0~~NODE_4692_length_1129_cov_53.023857_g4159_i0.p1  ORF type:complete len:375 (+),score=49.86 NODE_4692_length_1129_cov_53.023857_g4159_i0:38-1126(+)